MTRGFTILINGTSGCGKSSIAKEIQKQFDIPFWHVSTDQLVNAKFLPKRDFEGGKFDWNIMRPNFFKAFHNILPAICKAGNNIIVDHIIEEKTWLNDLQKLLKGYDVFFVGVHCDLIELEKREKLRLKKNPSLRRYIGESKEHLKTHEFCKYDLEVDTTSATVENVALDIIRAWKKRKSTSLFFK